jgi:hypothetical protein
MHAAGYKKLLEHLWWCVKMDPNKPIFVIPTYRLREVGDAVEAYDQNFQKFGNSMPIIVFDDSPTANFKIFYDQLENTSTHNEVFYVGPEEKSKFLDQLIKSTGITMSDYLIYKIFRPSFGGNRNFTVAYTIGHKFISSDDDMRPFGYLISDEKGLQENEVLDADVIHDLGQAEKTEFDIAGTFLSVLGKSPDALGMQYGEYIEDPHYDLFTNSVKNGRENGRSENSRLLLKPIDTAKERSKIVLAQSFRTGTSDMDAVELLESFINSDVPGLMDLRNYYVIRHFKPVVTNKNYRFDCGVSAYDNRNGLPPFLPTTLRFEDYGFRVWASGRPDIATAHVNSIQHHTRSTYMRPPLVDEVQNEAIANFLKRKIAGSIINVDEFGFNHAYDGIVTQEETKALLDSAKKLNAKTERAKKKTHNRTRKEALTEMQYNLRYLFNGYDADTFTSAFSKRIDEENYAIKDCMTYWPRVLEISSWMSQRNELPMRKVANKRK